MGPVNSAVEANLEGDFHRDDFYESFLAPKFHDFTSPEEPIDPDAYFLANSGVSRTKAVSYEEAKLITTNSHTVAAQCASKAAPVILEQSPIKTTHPAEKAVSSAKKGLIGTVSNPMTTVNGESSKTERKAFNSNTQVQCKASSGSLKSVFRATKSQSSENEDPNSCAIHAQIADASATHGDKSVRKDPEERPVLALHCNQKSIELGPTAGDSDVLHMIKFSVESCKTKTNFDDTSAVNKLSLKSNAAKALNSIFTVGVAGKVLKSKALTTACPPTGKNIFVTSAHEPLVTEPVSGRQLVASNRVCSYNGSISNSSTRAGTDPNFLLEAHNKNNDRFEVNDHSQDSLDDSFRKMALEHVQTSVREEQMTHEPLTVCVVPEVTQSEDEVLKEVSLAEEMRILEPTQSLSCGDAVGRKQTSSTWNKAIGNSEMGTTDLKDVSNRYSNASGMDAVLKMASKTMDHSDLRYPSEFDLAQSLQGVQGEFSPEAASKRANCAKFDTLKSMSKKICQAKSTAVSKSPHLTRPRTKRLSLAWRITNPRVTNPQPFRLRTQERGATKEQEFSKKVVELRAAKEGIHSAFQGLAAAVPKIPGRFLKPLSSHGFYGKRGGKEGEGSVAKAVIPPVQKAPLFNRPFKPHRSTRKLTVPQEPKFHRTRRACPSNIVAPA